MTVEAHAEALTLHEVSLSFGGVRALSDVSLTVEPGTIHAVIGPNGAGKSSTFNVISGIYRATSGAITYGAHQLTAMAPSDIARLGIGRTFQNIALTATDPVLENLMVARYRLTRAGYLATALRTPRAVREERIHRERVVELASFVGIEDLLHVPAGTLSYGQRKKVELARALATEPDLLLLDEPAAGLPTHEKVEMAAIICAISVGLGASVLVVEHDMPLVMDIADRVSVLDFGRLIASGAPDEVQSSPAVIAAYLGEQAPSDAHEPPHRDAAGA